MENEVFSKFSYRVIPSISNRYNEVEVTFNYGAKPVRKYYFAPKDKDPIEYVDQCVDKEIKDGSLKRYAEDFGEFKKLKKKSILVPVSISLLSAVALALGGLLAWKWLTPAPVTPPPVVDKIWTVVFRPSSENHKGHWEDNDKTETRIVKVKDNTLIKETDIPVAKPDAAKGGEFAYWSEEGKDEEINLSVTKITTDLVLEARYGGGEIDPETFEDHDDPNTNEFTMIYPREGADVVTYKSSLYNDHIKDANQIVGIPVEVDAGYDIVQEAKTQIENGNLDLIFVDDEAMLMKFLDSDIKFRRFDDANGIKEILNQDLIYEYQLPYCEKTVGGKKHLYAMPIFASPNVFLYRRSVAEEVIGNDDPTYIGSQIATMSDFNTLSVKFRSTTKKVLLTREDNFNLYKATRNSPWLASDSNKLIFTKEIQNFIGGYLDFAKGRFDNDYDYPLNNWWWNEEAYPDWMDKLRADESDLYTDYFGFPAPLWLAHSIATADGEESIVPSHGDWAYTTGPSFGTNGGQYILVPQGSKNPATALQFVTKLLTTDSSKYLLHLLAKSGGGVLPFHITLNKATLENMTTSTLAKSPFLGNQNPYSIFKNVLDSGSEHYYPCVYEKEIDGIIRQYAKAYCDGEISEKSEVLSYIYGGIANLDDRIEIQ